MMVSIIQFSGVFLYYWFCYIYNSWLFFSKTLAVFYRHHEETIVRELTRKPIEEMEIDKVELELRSRDDIPQILKGLQYIW